MLLAGLCASAPRVAAAATACPIGAVVGSPPLGSPPAGPALAERNGEVRLQWIDTHLAKTARRARTWTWGWGIGIVGATGANLVPLGFVPRDQRIDWYTGAATTIVGIVPLLIAPLDVVKDSRELHANLATPPNADAVCRLLADAEVRLARDARNQMDGQRWWLHVGNVILNSGVGLFLALGYHHYGAGALNAVVGSAIGEAIILTQPTGSIDDLRRYRDGALD